MKKSKLSKLAYLLLVIVLSITACSDDDVVFNTTDGNEPYFRWSSNNEFLYFDINQEEDSIKIQINSNQSWSIDFSTLSSGVSDLQISPSSGYGDTTVTIKYGNKVSSQESSFVRATYLYGKDQLKLTNVIAILNR